MLVLNPGDYELNEEWHEGSAHEQWRSALPCEPVVPEFCGQQLEALTPGFFEIDEGREVGEHTHSAEEILCVIEGSVKFTVGDQRAMLEEGGMAAVAADVPHAVRNVGKGTAKMIGVFAAPRVAHGFSKPIMPYGIAEFDPEEAEQASWGSSREV